MNELDELYAELERSDAAGNRDDVNALIAMIDEVEAEQAAAPQAPVDHAAVGIQSTIDDMGVGERALVGLGRGAANIVRGVQDGYYRATGDDDALATLNNTIEGERKSWEALAEQSTAASIGEFGGEVLATGVAGAGVIGGAAKLGARGYKAMALEGALVEGATTRGDLGERGKAAAWGAGLGVAGQGAIDLVGAKVNKFRRSRDVQGVAETARRPLDEAEDLIADTRAKGGFELDMADATGNNTALREKSDIMKLNDEDTLRQFMAQQELDIKAKAEGFVQQTGGTYSDNTAVGEDLSELLGNLRTQDADTYKDLYKKLDASTGGKTLNTDGLEEALPQLLNDHKISADGTVGKLNKVLKKYGVIQKKGDDVFLLDAQGQPMGGNLSPTAAAEKPVTAGNYEDLVQEINDLYKPLASKGENRVLGQTKKLLETWVDGAMVHQGASNELVKLGREARKARADFKVKWEQGDAVEKMTTKRAGADDFRMLPSQAVEHFTRPRNINDLKRLRGKLNLGNAADKKVWANMQQAPLLKAFQAATKNVKDVAEGGVPQFNEQAFKRVWAGLSPQSKEVLYGKAYVKQIDDAIGAWSQRGKRAKIASDDNPSGTARAAVGVMARLALPTGRAAGVGFASLGFLRDITQGIKKAKLATAGEHLADGKMTPNHSKALEKELDAKLRERYKGTDLLDYDRGIATLVRALARELGEDKLLVERE